MSGGTETGDEPLDRLRVWAASVLEPLLRIDGQNYNRAFTVGLLLTVLWVIVRTLTSQWGEQTRLMPLVVGVPTLVMLVALLVIQVSPRAAALADRLAADDVLGMEDRVEEMQSKTTESMGAQTVAEQFDAKMDVLSMYFWVLLLFGLVLVIGFTVGIPVYLLTYYRLRAELSWPRTVGFTLLVWAFIVVIFIYVLKAPLYPGLLGVHLPFL